MQKEIKRCPWVGNDPLYQKYHDEEWGIPVHDDKKLFEALLLDTFQAGLSWITILKKRENFRKAFDNFDPVKISKYKQDKIEKLMNDPGIIRNKLKILASISNAQAYLNIQKTYGTFDNYIWSFTDHKVIRNKWKTLSDFPGRSKESDEMSKSLKKNGFKFAGSTICYAFMQAVGMVNDHTLDCFCKSK